MRRTLRIRPVRWPACDQELAALPYHLAQHGIVEPGSGSRANRLGQLSPHQFLARGKPQHGRCREPQEWIARKRSEQCAAPRVSAVELPKPAQDPEERHRGIEPVEFGQALPGGAPGGQRWLTEDVLVDDGPPRSRVGRPLPEAHPGVRQARAA